MTHSDMPPAVPPQPRTVLQLFDQGFWWRTRDEQWLQIADMTPEHRFSTARMLERHSMAHLLRYEQAQLDLYLRFGAPDADACWLLMPSHETWMRGTALYRALEAGLPTRGKKRRQLAARARHWSSCPLRLRCKNRATDAVCSCAEAAQADQIARAAKTTAR